MEVSDFSSVLLSHQAMVKLNASLCGSIVLRNRGFDPYFLLNPRVLSSYSRSVVTGHSRWFAVKAGKKNSATAFDCRDCLASQRSLPRGGIS